eukprot:17444_1
MALCSLPETDLIQYPRYTPPSSPSLRACQPYAYTAHSAAFPTSYQYCGYLEVQNTGDNTWNSKYFVISNNFLLSAATPLSIKLDEVIYVEGSSIEYTESDRTFLLCPCKHPQLSLRSLSLQQACSWMNAIQKASKFKIKDVFRFLYTLGTSGMTKVVAAKHRTTHEESAIKIVDKRICNKQMLQTEIQILAKLDNEFIVNLYDVIETNKYLYIAMEMCDGGELFDRIVELDGDHYTEQDCCLIMHQIAKGVKYMHSVGIIHRDLKPENILCVEQDSIRKIKIADFGISKICDGMELEWKNDHDNMLCTVSYAAPEVLAGKKYDYRADYYSIGVILYILLCGYPPFSADEDECLIQSVLNDPLDFDDEDWDHVSAQTKDLVNGLLEKEPSARKTCDDILKLVWKVTNSTVSFAKARENFAQHVRQSKLKKYSFSEYNMAADELFDMNSNHKKMKKRGSASCSAIPGIESMMLSVDLSIDTDIAISISTSTTSDVSLPADFVFVEDY